MNSCCCSLPRECCKNCSNNYQYNTHDITLPVNQEIDKLIEDWLDRNFKYTAEAIWRKELSETL